MTEEVKVKGKGISTYVKERLHNLQNDQAMSFDGLVKELRDKFPHIKDNTSASARINLVLKQKKIACDYKKYKREVKVEGTDKTENQIWIVPKTDVEKEFDKQKAAALAPEKKEEASPEPVAEAPSEPVAEAPTGPAGDAYLAGIAGKTDS